MIILNCHQTKHSDCFFRQYFFNCFMGNNLDILVIENFFLIKEKQNKLLKQNYKSSFELD